MGSFNLQVNGVNVNAQHLIKIEKGVTQEQAMDAAKDNGLDEIMVYDQESETAYMAYGQGLNFGGLDGYQNGDKVVATLNGKQVAIVPFVANINGQAAQLIYDDEINSGKDGAGTALSVAKNVGLKVAGMAKDNALEIAGGAMTLGMFARIGGAKMGAAATQQALQTSAATIGKIAAQQGGKAASQAVGKAASQAIAEAGAATGGGFLTKMGNWAFGPAAPLAGQAFKGFGKVAKWGAIGVGVATVVGVGGTAAYGHWRSGNSNSIDQLGQKIH